MGLFKGVDSDNLDEIHEAKTIVYAGRGGKNFYTFDQTRQTMQLVGNHEKHVKVELSGRGILHFRHEYAKQQAKISLQKLISFYS